MAVVINGSGTVTGISVGGLPDDIVDSGTLADDAVGLAQMAGGTDGNIITYDTSGNPAAVSTGSSGQVLTSAGSGAAPTMSTLSPNTPSFSVYAGATLAMADNDTWYKGVYSTEEWDTNSCIAQGSGSTDNRFICPAGHAGKYLFNYGGHMTFSSGTDARMSFKIVKNTTLIQDMWSLNSSHQRAYGSWSVVIDLAEDDYVEVFASFAGYGWTSSSLFIYAGSNFKFQGYKLT